MSGALGGRHRSLFSLGSESMLKRITTIMIGAIICLLAAGLLWLQTQTHLGPQVSIKTVGFTNNSAGLLGVSDKTLALFSVTNRATSPIEATSFYYIETSGYWSSYAPLGSGGQIPPRGHGVILTRIPTNGTPWRVIVPYSRTTRPAQI